MNLYFMLMRRQASEANPVLAEVFRILARSGFKVETGIAEEMLVEPERWSLTHDLVLLKSHTELSLSLAAVLHDHGARLLNPYPSCAAVQDKIFAAQRLHAAGVPTPRGWATRDLNQLRAIVETHPLIIKPHRGYDGSGIHIVRHADDLSRLPRLDGPVLIQEYVEAAGADLKVYVVGEQAFAVRKTFSENSFAQPGKACRVPAEVESIACRCGRALGLGLYGLDIVEGELGPVVVDVNYFPGYKGIPGIAPVLADYIEAYARGRLKIESGAPILPIERGSQIQSRAKIEMKEF